MDVFTGMAVSALPRGHDALEIGDRVVIVTTNRGLRDINDILAK